MEAKIHWITGTFTFPSRSDLYLREILENVWSQKVDSTSPFDLPFRLHVYVAHCIQKKEESEWENILQIFFQAASKNKSTKYLYRSGLFTSEYTCELPPRKLFQILWRSYGFRIIASRNWKELVFLNDWRYWKEFFLPILDIFCLNLLFWLFIFTATYPWRKHRWACEALFAQNSDESINHIIN